VQKCSWSATRILEKQNCLQMSQIFSRSHTLVIRSFCFSRILQAGPRHPKVLNSKTSSIRGHESKPKRDMTTGSGDLPGPLTFTNFGPAKARPLHHVDAAPNPTLIPLNLAGLRRGLARNPVKTKPVSDEARFLHFGAFVVKWFRFSRIR